MDRAARIVLVGAGNMGGALLSGWLEAGQPGHCIEVVDPGLSDAMRRLCAAHAVAVTQRAGSEPADILVIAVKPQLMGDVLPGLRGLVGTGTVAVSVAAGTTVATIAEALFDDAPRVVRAMPNTPALVRKGVTACYATHGVPAARREQVDALMRAVGTTVWLDEEAAIDAVTGVSGSGPAYVFHMVEALAAAGRAEGLPDDTAMALARGTVAGAGALLDASDEEASTLRTNVTSPNGTTQAGLDVLMAPDGLTSLLTRTVAAASARARELAKG